MDINALYAEGLAPFVYPFYTIGLGWQPDERTNIAVIMTNRGMNLDLHYPTLYLYKHPFFGYTMTRTFAWKHPGHRPID